MPSNIDYKAHFEPFCICALRNFPAVSLTKQQSNHRPFLRVADPEHGEAKQAASPHSNVGTRSAPVITYPVQSYCFEKQIGRKVALEMVCRGVRHCIRLNFQNAVGCNAEFLERPILRPRRGQCTFQEKCSAPAPCYVPWLS